MSRRENDTQSEKDLISRWFCVGHSETVAYMHSVFHMHSKKSAQNSLLIQISPLKGSRMFMTTIGCKRNDDNGSEKIKDIFFKLFRSSASAEGRKVEETKDRKQETQLFCWFCVLGASLTWTPLLSFSFLLSFVLFDKKERMKEGVACLFSFVSLRLFSNQRQERSYSLRLK